MVKENAIVLFKIYTIGGFYGMVPVLQILLEYYRKDFV